jgi:class 3 adenylate cyclase
LWRRKSSNLELLRQMQRPRLPPNAAPAAAGQIQAASTAPNIRVIPVPPDAPAALEGEREMVAAPFADIKGSTELMEDLDPVEARAIIDPALKLMIDAALPPQRVFIPFQRS